MLRFLTPPRLGLVDDIVKSWRRQSKLSECWFRYFLTWNENHVGFLATSYASPVDSLVCLWSVPAGSVGGRALPGPLQWIYSFFFSFCLPIRSPRGLGSYWCGGIVLFVYFSFSCFPQVQNWPFFSERAPFLWCFCDPCHHQLWSLPVGMTRHICATTWRYVNKQSPYPIWTLDRMFWYKPVQ